MSPGAEVAGLPAARWRDLLTADLAPRAALVMLGIWLNAADGMVTATLMPSVARGLHAYAFFGWATAGYLAGSIIAGASAGQLAQRLGLRRACVIAACLYASGCVLSAAAPGIIVFLVGRGLQGIGSGWIVGFCYVAIDAVFPRRLMQRMFSATAGMWGIAALLGPLVGGVFAQAGVWRGAFWMFAVQGCLFAGATLALLPRNDERAAARPLAWRTLAVLSLAILGIALADVVDSARLAVALLCAGLVALGGAAWVNTRPDERLLPADAARPSTAAGAGYAMIFAMSAATGVIGVYEAAILQTVYGLSPLVAGYILAVEALAWTGAAFVVAEVRADRRSAFIAAGATTIVAGVALMAATLAAGMLWLVVVAGALVGGGFGLSWSLVTARILSHLKDEDRETGAAAVPTTQMIGGATGAAAAGACANLLGLAHGFDAARAIVATPWLFGAFVPIAALGWVAAMRLAAAAEQ